MKKKLVKHGNSAALIIDKSLLKLLGTKVGQEVVIKMKNNSLVITPVEKKTKEDESDEKIQKAFDEVMKKYGPALKKLAKN